MRLTTLGLVLLALLVLVTVPGLMVSAGEEPTSGIGVVVAELADCLADPNQSTRRMAASALGELRTEATGAIPALLRALDDDESSVCGDAAQAIGLIGASEALPHLLRILREESDPKRLSAISNLAFRGMGPDAVPALLECLDGTDPKMRSCALTALWTMGRNAAPAVPWLVRALDDASMRRYNPAGVLQVAAAGAPQAIPDLLALLERDDASLRALIPDILAAYGESAPEAIPVLAKALHDDDEKVRGRAVAALGAMGCAAVPALTAALSSSDPKVSRQAVGSLRHIGVDARAAVPDLLVFLASDDADIRASVAWALADIVPATSNAVAPLVAALADEDPRVRREAAAALGRMGALAHDARPAVAEALTDPEPRVRAASALAALRLGLEKARVSLVLLDLAEAEDRRVRGTAIAGLGEIASVCEEAVPVLVSALSEDGHGPVRKAAANALARHELPDPALAPKVLAYLLPITAENEESLRRLTQLITDDAYELTVKQAVNLAAQAHRHGCNELLEALARREKPDPWIVVEELVQSSPQTARAFAAQTSGPDFAALPAYAAAEYGREVRRPGADGGEVTRLAGEGWPHKVLWWRARAFAGTRRHLESAQLYREIGEAALEIGWLALAARAYWNAGKQHRFAWKLEETLSDCERYIEISRRRKQPNDVVKAHCMQGGVHELRGAYARALLCYDRALEAVRGSEGSAFVSVAQYGSGNVHLLAGDAPRARAWYERAAETFVRLGKPEAVAKTRRMIAVTWLAEGSPGKARAIYEALLDDARKGEDRREIGMALVDLGTTCLAEERNEEAQAALEDALTIFEELGLSASVGLAAGNLGLVHAVRGDYVSALACHERALAVVDRAIGGHGLAIALQCLSAVHLQLGNAREAADYAREAVAASATVASGQAEEAGAKAREQFAEVYGLGSLAGLALDDAETSLFFLESGRAGVLLESLGGRRALGAAVVPEDLLRAEAAARAAEAKALAGYRDARAKGEIRRVRDRQAALEEARQALHDVIERIQREARTAAHLVHPEPRTLSELRSALAADESLVLYGLYEQGSVALVVTGAQARVVTLPPTKDIQAAAEAVLLEERPWVRPEAVDALRRLVVEPLGLASTTRCVLVSPHGVLSYVPLSLLLPAHDIVHVPSATTWCLLRETSTAAGAGVLGLGDPDYRSTAATPARSLYRAGTLGRLDPLPGTRDEVIAVADETLLGPAATETALREAIPSRTRWRAVHFACHGLVDSDRPTLSSLALTASGDDDGFLTCMDVLRVRIPADLVVLSACETAKGRIYKAEGIVGLTRAFMFAGAPRVICSLWKVDDEATRALMVKFYELWNPKEGDGLGAAVALKKAQEYVQDHPDHPKWKHPYYWAAWVLWGLPD